MTTKMSDWTFLIGDVDWQGHGAKWCRKVAGVWWLLEFDNMAEWGDGARGYCCQVTRIDLGEVGGEERDAALRSCGLEMGELVEENLDDLSRVELVLVESLSGYGCKAPMAEITGTYPDRVRAQARRLADELAADDDKCDAVLDRTVNKIGSTARDFGRGDSLAGLRRTAEGVFEGRRPADAESAIMLKMYAAAEGRTLGGKNETALALAGAMLKEGE